VSIEELSYLHLPPARHPTHEKDDPAACEPFTAFKSKILELCLLLSNTEALDLFLSQRPSAVQYSLTFAVAHTCQAAAAAAESTSGAQHFADHAPNYAPASELVLALSELLLLWLAESSGAAPFSAALFVATVDGESPTSCKQHKITTAAW